MDYADGLPTDERDPDQIGTSPLGAPTAAKGVPELELLVYRGDTSSSHVLPPGGSLVIGRSRTADIFIDDASVSRRHVLLHVGSTLLVQDLGSQNGTRIGTTRIVANANTPVSVGVPFLIGAISVVVQRIGSPATAGAPRIPLRDEVASFERARILEALAACGGNQTKAAAALGMPRRTLILRLGEYGIPRPRR